MTTSNKPEDTGFDVMDSQGSRSCPEVHGTSDDKYRTARGTETVTESHPTLNTIRDVISSFLQDMSYTPLPLPRNTILEKALMHIVRSWHIDDGHGGEVFERIAKYSVALSDLSYNHHDFDVRLQISLFTWFGIYMDDVATRVPTALQSFQERLHQGLPQLDPVLTHFGPHLSDMYQYFEPLCANSIICAALEFVNGCALEVNKEVTEMPLGLAASETGIAPVYGFMIFPKQKHPHMTIYLKAMADIIFFINVTNDILSFYKEELAGEEGNYIHKRSKALGEEPVKVLADVVGEALAARERIIAVLKREPEALVAWQTYEQGYITFHISQERYRLGELDPSLAVELL